MIEIPPRAAERALLSYELDAPTGCHISTYSVGSHGYAQIGWWDKAISGSRGTTAHRAAWTAVHGPIPPGMTVDHRCLTLRCVNVDHLRLLTNAENGADGARRRWSRLTDEEVRAIRSEFAVWTTPGSRRRRSNAADLAARYGVTREYVSQLGRGLYRKEVA